MSLRILYIGGPLLVPALAGQGHVPLSVSASPQADISIPHPFTVAQLKARLDKKNFKPDVLFYCDDGNMPLLLDPQNAPWPSIRYTIDTYCNPWHIPYAYGFDRTLVAQKDYVELFAREGLESRWFPLFCYGAATVAEGEFAARDIPVAFVGTLGHKNNPGREPFLKNFRVRHPLVILSGNFRPIFSRSRIALNQTAASEVNFRCFEAPACGAALLMENCGNGLAELLVPGEEILPLYQRGNAADAAAIAANALADPELLAEIARAGQTTVLAKHTDAVRAVDLAAQLSELCAARAHRGRLEDVTRRGNLVRSAFGMLASELTDPKWTEYRIFFEKVCAPRS